MSDGLIISNDCNPKVGDLKHFHSLSSSGQNFFDTAMIPEFFV